MASLMEQFCRFAAIGLIGTAVHYFVLITLVHLGEVAPILASGCGFVGGALTNYLLNYRYTFNSRISHLIGLPKFLAVASAGLALNSLVMLAGLDAMNLHYLPAQIVATGVVLIWNFFGNRIWTFRASNYENNQQV